MWTINDAKEGDILVTKWKEEALGEIFIFKGIEKYPGGNRGYIKWHCMYDMLHRKFSVSDGSTHLGPADSTIVRPATEEEEFLLLDVMDDFNCYWDEDEMKMVFEDERPMGKPVVENNDQEHGILHISHLNGIQRSIVERLVESWNK